MDHRDKAILHGPAGGRDHHRRRTGGADRTIQVGVLAAHPAARGTGHHQCPRNAADQQALGLSLTVFTAIKTHEHTRNWFDRFHAVTTSMPNVMEVHRMSGDVDYLLRAVVPDMKSYDDMYKEMIEKINLFDVSSSFSMETIKYTTALPLDYID